MINLYEVEAVISDSALSASGVEFGVAYKGVFRSNNGPNLEDVIPDVRRVQMPFSGVPELSGIFAGYDFIIENMKNFGIPVVPDESTGIDVAITFWDQDGRRDGVISIVREVIV